jgi:hypothetical protein
VAALRFGVKNNVALQLFRTIAHWNPIAIVDAVGMGVEVGVMIPVVL